MGTRRCLVIQVGFVFIVCLFVDIMTRNIIGPGFNSVTVSNTFLAQYWILGTKEWASGNGWCYKLVLHLSFVDILAKIMIRPRLNSVTVSNISLAKCWILCGEKVGIRKWLVMQVGVVFNLFCLSTFLLESGLDRVLILSHFQITFLAQDEILGTKEWASRNGW